MSERALHMCENVWTTSIISQNSKIKAIAQPIKIH